MHWPLPSSRILSILRYRKGMALVLVLSFLVLLSALILAFFGSVTTETKASRFADSGSRGRELAETATNIVMAQIREATTRGSNIAWASQPGMIRTYGVASGTSSGASSAPLAYYKLYSAERMSWTPADGAFSPAADVPADWHTLPALYTDLNLPVKSLAGARIYPIMDPTAATVAPVTQGFAITSAPVKGTNAEDNPAPMPVRWLYVLQDGTLTSPSGSAASEVTWAPGTAKSPSKTNPVVGRVAFWTDDESSKVNINTAAGDEWGLAATEPGSYWDVPHLFTDFEKNKLALRQPAQLEYQRYPGHPATTYLSAVIPSLTREQIGLIAPRLQTGGSKGGTVWAPGKVLLDTDRLYASVDELIYNPDRTTQAGMDKAVVKPLLERSRFFLTAHSRAPEVTLFNTPRVSIWPIHDLTNTAAAKYRSPFDELIAFCSQYRIAGVTKEYFFKRNDPLSVTSDLANISRNQELYTYLQNLTSREIPGFGGKFDQKYPLDRDQILTEIFDYIRSTNLFDDSIEPQSLPWSYPTKGKQFTKGRSGESSGVAGHGQAAPIYRPDPASPADVTKSTMGFGRFDTISEVGLHFICTADGSGDPAQSDATNVAKVASNKTANRTLVQPLANSEKRVEALLLLELFSAAHGWTALCRDIQIEVVGLNQLSLKGAADGAAQPMGFPATARMHITQTSAGTIHGRGWGGLGGFRTHMRGRGLPARGNMAKDGASTNMDNTYPFVSAPVTIKPGAAARMFLESSGPITINIYAGGTSTVNSTQLVQSLHMNFTGHTSVTEFPAPQLAIDGASSGQTWMHTSNSVTEARNWWTFSRDGAITGAPAPNYGRIYYVGEEPGRNTNPAGGGEASGNPIRKYDTVRTLVPFHGDYRLIAAQRDVPEGVFKPHQYYNDTSKLLAHSMTEVLGADMIYGATMTGKLVKTAAYASSRRPDVPFRADADGGPWSSDSGDFDNGLGPVPDGAYINKPDEGSAYDGAADAIPYFSYTERHETAGPTFFSPNRQVMSPVMFGSLPSQVKANVPWRTLLFRPNTGVATHVGAQSPKDHLLLDLFWMPVVEPYAISEPFSTAGKINMNYQIMPFTYIERSTGLRALLRSERVAAVPLANANNYKTGTATNFRLEIDAAQTLEQFKTRFAANDIFKSPTELCDLYLVPQGATLANMATYWNTTNTLTGDNMKERPYATLYPRLTTKSNTYTVHYRVQALRQAVRSRGDSPDAWAKWNETNDLVVSETRGSTVLERYIDPEDSRLQDYATKSASASDYVPLDTLYRFRVIHSKRFLP
ncbi:Verru_Chthon cassette protein A [Verrucomicrobium sp. BvORR106]|uniref:Verru_Chthon cassette protein A n=1 Tax=Verrucomicrobium sp. BvORR106 TaxID=1403819 RepID=UPI0009DED68F|nr:Verru_Chthon cassette protein A [Verrucomicrobium sp. BvORR106]